MHTVLSGTGLVITVVYVIFVLLIYTGLRRLTSGTNKKQYTVSIVIAVRNEEDTIHTCLNALLAQNYPDELLEIIVINDRSEDATHEIVEKYRQQYPHIRLIDIHTIPDNYAPKKYALAQGINAASGVILCTTDADCVPPPSWIAEMVSYFEDDVGFVAGFSPLYKKRGGNSGNRSTETPDRINRGLFADFLYMDSIGLAAASAGGIGRGTAWTCAGRNLAYRKAAFEEIGGFEQVKHIVSGDDDLLMFLIHQKTNWRLRYAVNEKAAVPSYDDTDFRQFAHQRARHSSKFFVHPLHVKVASMVVFLFYLTFLFYPVYMIISWRFLSIYPVMAGGKFLVELFTIRKGARLFGAQYNFTSFVKAFFIHPFVIVFFSLLGSRGKFTWKGRKFKR